MQDITLNPVTMTFNAPTNLMQTAPECEMFNPTDDMVLEGPQSLTLMISSVNGPTVTITTPNTIVLNIVDNEGIVIEFMKTVLHF